MTTLLKELTKLRDNGLTDPGLGICANLPDEYQPELKDLFKKWPKYSGDRSYPIPGGSSTYISASNSGDLWDKTTAYGRLRWELLDWLIEQLSPAQETEPKTFGELTSEEKGLLLLAYHEGKTIQFYSCLRNMWWDVIFEAPLWAAGSVYRVKPEPEATTFEIFCSVTGGCLETGHKLSRRDTHKITITTIDGVVQPTATVEKI